jgi:signal transduction histidine kinase
MERTRELATLNTIAGVVSGTLDLKEIMGAALDKAMEAMRMDIGTAYSLQPGDTPDEDKLLLLAAGRGLSAEFSQHVGSRRLRGTGIQVAAEAHKPLVWLVADYPDPALKPALEREGVRQVINVPLFAKGKFVGAFNLATRHEREITPEEIALLGAIGQQVAVAVENAHLYDRAEQSAALAERSRLARELHDSVTQSLYGVTMYAEAAQLSLTAGDRLPAAQYLCELRDTAQEALREMRLLIYELRPPALEKRGLAAVLQERLETVEARGGVKTELHVEGAEALPLPLQDELYHIAREALNNTLKHARAQTVRVMLACADGSACLEISDDGLGFDPSNQSKGGLGLAGMKERVQKIGGHLDIETATGHGTRLVVHVPLPLREAE